MKKFLKILFKILGKLILAAVIFFVWKFGNGLGFTIIEGIFAVYGFASLADDCCRWLQMPDTAIMRGGQRI